MAELSSNPKRKKTYAKSHQEFIGNPAMQGGRTARAKADLKKAIKGGAAKAAKKLAPRDVINYPETTKVFDMGNGKTGVRTVRLKPTKSTSWRQEEKRKKIAANIINDKSKTAMRAKIIEMNKMKRMGKKK
jgi:hypothetical protein